jgi:hypothetical protein
MNGRGSPSPSGNVMLPPPPLDDSRPFIHPPSLSDPSLPFLFGLTRTFMADPTHAMPHNSTTHILCREIQQAAGLRSTAQRRRLFPIALAPRAQFTRAEGCHTWLWHH